MYHVSYTCVNIVVKGRNNCNVVYTIHKKVNKQHWRIAWVTV